MSAADDYARRGDIDRLDRAVEGLRADLRDVERRGSDAREADNRTHAAEHKALEQQIDGNRTAHEAEHEAEETARAKAAQRREQQVERKKDGSWAKGIALAAAIAGSGSSLVAWLVFLRGH